LKGKGESITVARFLMFANRFPVKRMDQVNAARWLRDAAATSRARPAATWCSTFDPAPPAVLKPRHRPGLFRFRPAHLHEDGHRGDVLTLYLPYPIDLPAVSPCEDDEYERTGKHRWQQQTIAGRQAPPASPHPSSGHR
jgi:hypothetical protein